MRPLSEEALRDLARQQVAAAGSLRRWALAHDLTLSMVHRWLAGDTPCPPSVAAAMGYGRVVRYLPLPPTAPDPKSTP